MNFPSKLAPPLVLPALLLGMFFTGWPLPGHASSPSPPFVKGGATKDGALLRGKVTADRRVQVDYPRQPANAPNRPASTDDHGEVPMRSFRRAPRAEIRLNIGMCGRVQPDGTVPGPAWCQPFEPTRRTPGVTPSIGAVVERRPQPQDVTWEMVWEEVKQSVFPKLPVIVQPKGRTLVNLDTIVYTHRTGVTVDSFPLVGFPVVVEATPMSYTWRFGDGTQLTTTSPGSPYPSKEITHKYRKRAHVGLTVTVHYGACYTVADLGPQCIEDIPITGPVTSLVVREAVPVLVEPGG